MTNTTRRLIVTASNKGGVGKSIAASLLTHFYKTQGVNADIYDADGSVGALVGMYADANAYDARVEKEVKILLNSLRETSADVVLHDMPGGSMTSLIKVINGDDGDASADTLVEAIERSGFELTVLHVLSFDLGSVRSVQNILRTFGTSFNRETGDAEIEPWAANVRHVACINTFASSDEADFPYWFTTKNNVRRLFLGSGGIEFKLPRLRPGVVAQIQAEKISWQKAVTAGESPLDFADETTTAKFLRNVRRNIDEAEVGAVLGL